ncbi:MAG: hypothetical protein INH43_19195 [Acidobacteriaceae bacterium]|jgi:hypothetical protein|nr:hypothetical protein [Acidobacteriaceae bacterium]
MACYISSNHNRFYTALETEFGATATVTEQHRIPAIRMAIKNEQHTVRRRDKTGSRSRMVVPTGGRDQTEFRLETYLTNWANTSAEPPCGPLFRAALGAPPLFDSNKVIASINGRSLTMGGPHGMQVGQALSLGSELRFVQHIVNSTTVQLNAPFSISPSPGAPLNPTITYGPATQLPSVSLFDYWSPATAVQRLLSGAAVNFLKIKINGDFHEVEFHGEARRLIDSASFNAGVGSVAQFPAEPNVGEIAYQIVPGHLGQVWMGSTSSRFYTLTDAEVSIKNNIDMRRREFGFDGPRCLSAGEREVGIRFRLLEQDDDATKGLYAAARNREPISVMLQLGELPGQLCAIYLPTVVPEVPEFDDRNPRLEWAFGLSQASGTVDDEIRIAFA